MNGRARLQDAGTQQVQRRIATLVVLGTVVALPATAHAAQPATVTGSVAGVTAPPAGKGEASLRALDIDTGALAGSAPITSRGRFKLTVAAGPYAFLAGSLRFPGRARVDKLVGSARLKAGRTTKLTLSTKGRTASARQAAGPVLSGIGNVSVGHPAIWIKSFKINGGGPDYAVLSKGLSQMLVTDLVGSSKPCGAGGRKYEVVERERIKDVLDELKRSQSKYFDPATTPKPGRLIKDNATVTGSLTVTGSGASARMTLSTTYTEGGGYTATVTAQGPASDFFALEEKLAADLKKKICKPTVPLPKAWEGTVSGSFSQPPSSISHVNQQWTGTARYEQNASGPGFYSPVAGRLTYTTSGTDSSGCTHNGTGEVALSPGTVFGNLGLIPLPDRTDYVLAGYWTSDEATSLPSYPVTVVCPERTSTESAVVELKWLLGNPAHEQAAVNAKTLAGTRNETAPNGVQRVWTWNLSAK